MLDEFLGHVTTQIGAVLVVFDCYVHWFLVGVRDLRSYWSNSSWASIDGKLQWSVHFHAVFLNSSPVCRHLYSKLIVLRVRLKMTQNGRCDYAVIPKHFGLKFYPVTQLCVLHKSADFCWNNLLFLKMAQNQSRSSIFATQPLRPKLFMLTFDDLKQMLQKSEKWQPILTAIIDRTRTACNHSVATVL